MGYEKTNYPGIFKYVGKGNATTYIIDFYVGGKRSREVAGPTLEEARAELMKRFGK